MSLLGRKIIDQFKTSLPRLTLPVPPYGSGKYWEKVYNTLGVNDVYEWGDLTMEDLEIVRYKKQFQDGIRDLYGDSVVLEDATTTTSTRIDSSSMVEEDFEKVIGVSLIEYANYTNGNDGDNHDENDNPAKSKSSILILGCGNSNLGEEIYSYYDKQYATHQNMHADANADTANDKQYTNAQQQASAIGMNISIIQCDISPSVVSTMSERYAHLPNMSIVQADACSPPNKNTKKDTKANTNTKSNEKNKKKTSNSMSQSQSQSKPSPFPFRNQSIDAIVDKGLMDALFCSEKKLMPRVMMNVHQSLKCGSVFMFFSFSRPEYLLKETIVRDTIWETDMDMNINGDDDNDDNEKNSASNVNNVNNDKDRARGRVLDLWSQVDVCELDTIFMYRFVKKINSDIQIDFVETNGRMGVGMELLGAKPMPSMHTRRKIKR